MSAAKVQRNNNKTFDVIDTRDSKILTRGLKGSKAAAYATYYNEQISEAEAFWHLIEKRVVHEIL